jgi:hypothetical protein
MELPRLAAKQKRYMDILHFAQEEVQDSVVKPNLLKVLAEYKGALAKFWSDGAATPQNVAAIESIERELEALHNQARLRSNAP